MSAQDDIQRALTTMAWVCAAYRSDAVAMSRKGEPVGDLRPDGAARMRPFAFLARRPSGHEQHDAIAGADRAIEPGIQGGVGRRQRMAVEVEGAVGDNGPVRQPPIPAAVEPGEETERLLPDAGGLGC